MHNRVEGRPMGKAGWRDWQEGKQKERHGPGHGMTSGYEKQENIGQGRARHDRVMGRFSSGQDRTGVREVAVAGTGTGNDRSKGRNKDRSRAVTGAGTGTGLSWAGLG